MIKLFNMIGRTLCLFLMIHLLAMSVCDDYLLKIFNKSDIEILVEIEKDNDKNNEDKSFEFDDVDSEYLVNYFNHPIHFQSFNIQHNCSITSFQYLQIALPQRISEILIPPPRA